MKHQKWVNAAASIGQLITAHKSIDYPPQLLKSIFTRVCPAVSSNATPHDLMADKLPTFLSEERCVSRVANKCTSYNPRVNVRVHTHHKDTNTNVSFEFRLGRQRQERIRDGALTLESTHRDAPPVWQPPRQNLSVTKSPPCRLSTPSGTYGKLPETARHSGDAFRKPVKYWVLLKSAILLQPGISVTSASPTERFCFPPPKSLPSLFLCFPRRRVIEHHIIDRYRSLISLRNDRAWGDAEARVHLLLGFRIFRKR